MSTVEITTVYYNAVLLLYNVLLNSTSVLCTIGCILPCWILHIKSARSVLQLFLLLSSSHISGHKF